MEFPHDSVSLNDSAIILSDRGVIKKKLSYNEVYEIKNLITNFISNHITSDNQCIGLRMTHNVYIPSIILSLQELQHCFIFLPLDDKETLHTIEQLCITWVISFINNEKCVATLTLNEDKLSLEKHCCKQTTTYKDLYYIIKTSGTTGESKYVKVGKESIESNITSLSKIFKIQKTDVVYFGTTLTFDPSMVELLLALNNGACLLITISKSQINPTYLYDTLFHPHNGISVLQIVPSLFSRWSEQQIIDILLNKKLNILAFGGECFPQSLLSYKRSDSLRIFNLYGITEISCWATIFEVGTAEIENVPLGDALDDTLIEIRDESGNPINDGEGEIYIGSTNRICFVNDEINPRFRATGDIAEINNSGIFYKGRKNDVIKRFGHKLHLSYIEQMVEKETTLSNTCVWLKSQSKLLLFLIIETFDEQTKNKILDKVRIKLLHTLPKQHFPDYIDIVRKCPVTSHGKLNKNALESIYLNRSQTVKKTATDILESLFCKYFGISKTHLSELQEATFFDLGGNSILAVQFLNEFREEVGADCPDFVTALFEKDIATCFQNIHCVQINKRRRSTFKNDHGNAAKKTKTDVELKIAWRYNLQACVDSSPLVFQLKEQILVAVGSFSHIFVVLDAVKGEEIAKFVLPDVIEASPCVSPCCSYLYVGCFDGCLYCLDFKNNSIKWFYPTCDRIKCKPALCQEFTSIVFGSYDKHVHCINTENGSCVWKTSVEESVTATPVVEKKKIYIATICGSCLCLSETNGDILWRLKTANPIFGSPCIIDDTIAWPNVNGCILFLSSNGDKIDEFKSNGYLYSSLIRYNDMIIFGSHNHSLYILEIDNGHPKIKKIVELNDVLTTPCVFSDRIAVAGNSGRIFLVDFEGAVVADTLVPGNIFSSIVVHDQRLFVGCRDNNLYCIEVKE
ncbi:hypothetical protein Zmor_010736 [Zophobas morio]|uniref:Acyl-CoA synthetase family member 4 n=1 Tax=Zophobas morio TaxID=2755281 RepID=A0AA38IKU3_9CUCU|nr:hypothetical protein Zmor_010736 [Zophobas morio]